MKKPAFLAILAACLAVTAVSLGYAASRLLATRYFAADAAPPAPERTAGEPRGATTPPERWTNLFAPDRGMDLPSRVAQGAGAGTAGAATASSTPYLLVGTITSPSRESRRAILWTEGMKEPRAYREGEEIEPGIRVAGVERDFVWLGRGAAREKLEILPVGTRTRTVAPPSVPSPRTSAGAPAAPPAAQVQVNRLGENSFAIDESSVNELTQNINQFMTQVRIIPYFEGNRSAGYRLAAIRPGSAFEQLGFRGGDVIQRVNDVELSSPEKMYTIFQNLRDMKRVQVDVLRQGNKTTLTYEIR